MTRAGDSHTASTVQGNRVLVLNPSFLFLFSVQGLALKIVYPHTW